jgi:SAM-dependent methyltransferase
MDEREYRYMAAVEDRHFWFVETRRIIRDALLAASVRPDDLVMDLGCATGGMMASMGDVARFVGVDVNPFAARLAHQRSNRPVVLAEAGALPFADGSFDGVTALDVLEHIEDDSAAVAELRRVLRPGGLLLAMVPCHPLLFSEHDRALQHVRRYTRPRFLELLQEGGFRPERVTWVNSILFPVAAAVRLASRLDPRDRSDRHKSNAALSLGLMNNVLGTLFSIERKALKHVNMPMGLSLLVAAR